MTLIYMLLILQSCSVINKKGSWGKKALYPLRSERLVEAIKKNASSGHVWGPLIGVGVVTALDLDRNISNWVHHEGAIYKDVRAADNWSDHFNNIQKYEMYAVILLTPSHDEDMSFTQYLYNKVRGGFALNIASSSTRFTVDQVRKVVHRQRPNRMDMKILPSGHASEAGARRVIVSKGVDAIDMKEQLRTGIKFLNTGMSAATIWARVEGKRHYPSDVLAGYALGSFVSGVVYDFLMNDDSEQSFSFIPMKDKYSMTYTISF